MFCLKHFLQLNYYIVTPSSLSHISYFPADDKTSQKIIASSSLIGIANLSSIFSSIFQTCFISFPLLIEDSASHKHNSNHHLSTSLQDDDTMRINNWNNIKNYNTLLFKNGLLLCAIFPFLGNLLYLISLKCAIIKLAFIGRLFIGFGCTDIILRTIIICVAPSYQLIPLSFKCMAYTWLGKCLGLFLGGLLHPKIISVLLCCLWLFQLFGIIYIFQEPSMNARHNDRKHNKLIYCRGKTNKELTSNNVDLMQPGDLNTSSYSSEAEISETFYSDSSNNTTPYQTPTKKNVSFDLMSPTNGRLPTTTNALDLGTIALLQQHQHRSINTYKNINFPPEGITNPTNQLRCFTTRFFRLRKLFFGNYITFPITCFMILFTKFSEELLLSSFAIINNRYYDLSDVHIGIILACFSLLALPSYFIADLYTKLFNERRAIKVKDTSIHFWCNQIFRANLFFQFQFSLIYVGIGLFLMINYHTFMPLRKLLFRTSESSSTSNMEQTPTSLSQPSTIGKHQYILASIIIFTSCVVAESSTFSLMSKVVPLKKKFSVICCGLLVIILSSIARYMANSYISFAVVFNSRVIDIDIGNLLYVPLILVCAIVYVLVQKNYFFLI